MSSFLKYLAKDLLEKYGNNLSEITVVFPNKRASLFLNEELILQSGGKPVWSPKYLTISELFRSLSTLVTADQIQLVCELFKHYSQHTHSPETLDDFYGWGELMLSDFDDIDKNIGDYTNIFHNTSELHDFDSIDFLTAEQKRLIERFFRNFEIDNNSLLKENFSKLWNKLLSIYISFKQALRAQGIAYEGMLYRDVAENCPIELLTAKKYIFAGFNLLQKVEQKIFETIQREGKASFYWDYDTYYMENDNEAGKYIHSYLSAFPNELSGQPIYSNLTKKDNITFLSASTEEIQARYISQWLTPERIKAGKRTAIILSDEKLLPTVVHCLPPEVKEINITTGYPLSQTLVATLVKEIISLKLSGESRLKGTLRLHQVNSILHHPYMKYISDKAKEIDDRLNENHIFYPTISELSADDTLTTLFSPLTPYSKTADSDTLMTRNKELLQCIMTVIKRIAIASSANEADSQSGEIMPETETVFFDQVGENKSQSGENKSQDSIMQESLYRMYQIVTRINTMLNAGELNLSELSLQSLINQIVRSTSVPFHGEPIMGIQIMGVLETRLLDFDHILILSANEGNIPKGVNDSSFIPHAIRKAYGLTTVENKVGIYAYYFHRMIQRSSDVTLTYNNSTNDTKTNEMSRFMMQLMSESGLDINHRTIVTDLKVSSPTATAIEKSHSVLSKLNGIESISATAINQYLRCQKSFFYRFICGIEDNDESDEETMDSRSFGTIFHKAAEIIYLPFIGKDVNAQDIKNILADPSRISRAVDDAFRIELFHIDPSRPMPALDGMQLINRNIVITMIKGLLQYDMRHVPFHIQGLEMRISDTLTFDTSRGKKTLNVKGFIDRLDIVTGFNGNKTLRVVDYKTGASRPLPLKSVEEIFSPTPRQGTHPAYYLQTLLYSRILASPEKGNPYTLMPVSPALLYPHFASSKDYDPTICFDKSPIHDVKEHLNPYLHHLSLLLSDMFDETKPFNPAPDTTQCSRCFYHDICGE